MAKSRFLASLRMTIGFLGWVDNLGRWVLWILIALVAQEGRGYAHSEFLCLLEETPQV